MERAIEILSPGRGVLRAWPTAECPGKTPHPGLLRPSDGPEYPVLPHWAKEGAATRLKEMRVKTKVQSSVATGGVLKSAFRSSSTNGPRAAGNRLNEANIRISAGTNTMAWILACTERAS